jgi:hypothetical protein
MQDQRRLFISLAAAVGLVVASAGAYAVFHAQDTSYDEAEADADLLDDLDTFPTLKKGDRSAPLTAGSNAAEAPATIDPQTVAVDTTVVMTPRRSAFRPAPPPEPVLPRVDEDPSGPQLAYANPNVPALSPDAPFRAIERAPEPEPDALDDPAATPLDETLIPPPSEPSLALPVPRPKPANVPQLAALTPDAATPIEVPLPRRKPAVPKLVETAPGPMVLGQVPAETARPLRVEPTATPRRRQLWRWRPCRLLRLQRRRLARLLPCRHGARPLLLPPPPHRPPRPPRPPAASVSSSRRAMARSRRACARTVPCLPH